MNDIAGATTDLDEFFAGHDASRRIFKALRDMIASIGEAQLRVSKSEIAFSRRRTFARAWIPERYLGPGHAPLVLTLGFRRRDPSARWKQIVEPARGRFTHHLELFSAAEIDEEVRGWLQAAWDEAAC